MKILRGIRRFFSNLVVFFRETRQELRKVVWPTWGQLRVYTLAVILSMIGVGVVLWGTDALLSFLLGHLIK